ncbi:MAG TPA: LuxR C-terminal-related transcriptional regulator [Polyangiaceae bacterium]|nr:LuxR C-terminal-related transcriptional regulator [Polyangiaceae bacterium]
MLSDTHNEFDLVELWRSLTEGRLFISRTVLADGRCSALLTSPNSASGRLRDDDVGLLELVLRGEAQKVVADMSFMTVSSVSNRCSRALRGMAGESPVSRVSMVVVMAAHAAGGLPLPKARIERSEHAATVISVEFPPVQRLWPLSSSEAEILRMTLEGRSHEEIALTRRTARRTIANQLASVFRKVGVSGRTALKARAVVACSREWSARTTVGSVGAQTTTFTPSPNSSR